jgi:succinate dehydrogenase / fumarate reductase cytochrome b subunit
MSKNNQVNLDSSVIGKKIFLGFSGLVLLSFVTFHLLGNLSVFAGPDAINNYAHFLHSHPNIINVARSFLLLNLSAHVYYSVSLTLTNRAARQVPYEVKNNMRETFASGTMIISGVIILLFVCFHLAHFTLGYIQPENYHMMDTQGRVDVYTMLIRDFQSQYIVLVYLAAMMALGLHLSHAFFSVCQTFSILSTGGSIHQSVQVSRGIALVLILGYLTIPFSIFLKVIEV